MTIIFSLFSKYLETSHFSNRNQPQVTTAPEMAEKLWTSISKRKARKKAVITSAKTHTEKSNTWFFCALVDHDKVTDTRRTTTSCKCKVKVPSLRNKTKNRKTSKQGFNIKTIKIYSTISGWKKNLLWNKKAFRMKHLELPINFWDENYKFFDVTSKNHQCLRHSM